MASMIISYPHVIDYEANRPWEDFGRCQAALASIIDLYPEVKITEVSNGCAAYTFESADKTQLCLAFGDFRRRVNLRHSTIDECFD